LRSVEESYRGERVRVFRLDRERLLSTLRARARALLAGRPEVLEVRLFGSLARDTATPGSDADVWVLLRDGDRPARDRAEDVARFFEGAGVGCDVLVHGESEWDRLRRDRRRIVDAVLAEGVELAHRRAP
jgi:predicted nucleotidyltransferase